ncbi:MAG: aminomethyl-transferring glycine dehydrogenase subunit GcvPB [Elusimicrobiota bacterium]
MKLIYQKSIPERKGINIDKCDVPEADKISDTLLRSDEPGLPEVSELDLVRHYTKLSDKNFCIDKNFYPLGSCTMKYNPKVLEHIASFEEFTKIHPFIAFQKSGKQKIQGILNILHDLQNLLSEITGMAEYSLQPLAGAHGELTGMLIARAYHKLKNNNKKYVIVPDTSHGTNPASVSMAGYEVITIPTDKNGEMDINIFKQKLNHRVAAVMMTCPNTLGIFNTHIKEICDAAHSYDCLMYYDGANLNSIIGKVKPGDMGFDIIHLNLHKTFSTPHGGGGPGSGPVGVKQNLIDFLPMPRIVKTKDNDYDIVTQNKKSIGQVSCFFGNFSVLIKAYAYILLVGKEGLKDISDKAVLNANYIMEKLKQHYLVPFYRRCMHECVISAQKQAENRVRAFDIAKFLIDRNIHPPTIYFPLIVKEAMMIEPTETESKQTLDEFISAMIKASELAGIDPETLHHSPDKTPVGRLDEVHAARNMDICHKSD